MKRILLVCTGNTCRSPMAEAMLRQMAEHNGMTLDIRSAGVSTMDGMPVSAPALESLRKREIDHKGTSRVLTLESIDWADLILTMTSSHKRSLLQWFPNAVEKTFTLKEYAYQDDQVNNEIAELEKLYGELQIQQALGGQLKDEDRKRLFELEKRIPSFDIADPFGGSQSIYDECSYEIEEALSKLLDKLNKK